MSLGQSPYIFSAMVLALLATTALAIGRWANAAAASLDGALVAVVVCVSLVAVPYYAISSFLLMCRAGENLCPSAQLPLLVRLNPYNAVFFPQVLSRQGLGARACFLKSSSCLALVVACLLVALQ